MLSPNDILKSARNILLVDWADPEVPRTLVKAGFTVFCASPGRYSLVELMMEYTEVDDSDHVIPPEKGDEGYLVFRQLENRPINVDVVNVYRPEAEHAEIIAHHVLPLGARVLWLQPSIGSGVARDLAIEKGLVLVEGIDIAYEARHLGQK